MEPRAPVGHRMKRFFFGKAHNPSDPNIFHNISLIALFAWIGLGSDALSSSAYGPSEAFNALGSHTYLALFVALFTILTIFIISSSYKQIIELFPHGGGGYLVASKLLSPNVGMVSGCALLIDYVLTITISIASGADAIFSFLPESWHGFKFGFAIFLILVLIFMNLRGVKESIKVLVPIFMVFVVGHLLIIIYAIIAHFTQLPAVFINTSADFHKASIEIGFWGVLFLLLKAYSMGAGTYTGIEAVSNGMNTLREPRVKTAKKTMNYMAISLAFMVLGLIGAYLLYNVTFEPGKTLNASLFEKITGNWGPTGHYFVLILLFSEAAILFVAAQTGFLAGPKILANMSLDRWFPSTFTALSDRLVSQNGILIMGGAAIAMMFLTGGSVSFIVVLYSITVFITFTLSQLGMIKYWWTTRNRNKNWKKKILVNGIGFLLTFFILISVIIVKFDQGGWITIFILGALIAFVLIIKRYYNKAKRQTKKLDILVLASETPSLKGFLKIIPNNKMTPKPDYNEKTAVIMVNGYNGIGLSAISSIFRMFGDSFKNFVFVEIGVIDSGVFKGTEELKNLQEYIKKDSSRYVEFMKRNGYHSENITAIGIDVVEKTVEIAPKILKKYPNAVFFGGQLVFKEDNFMTKLLHNYTVFAVEKRLFPYGIPFIIIPIKV